MNNKRPVKCSVQGAVKALIQMSSSSESRAQKVLLKRECKCEEVRVLACEVLRSDISGCTDNTGFVLPRPPLKPLWPPS